MRLRPASLADVDAAFEVIVARDLADLGEADYTREDVQDDWSLPWFSLDEDARVAELDGRILGVAYLRDRDILVNVHPDHEGRGAGTALRLWAEDRARAAGRRRYRQHVPDRNAAARALLEAAGYRRVRSYWWLRAELHGTPPEPRWPDGIRPRGVDPEADARELHAVSEAAFADEPSGDPEPFETFRTEHLRRSAFASELSLLAEREGDIAGFALCERRREGYGHVALLAVVPAEAGRGIGRALLLGALRRFAEAGLHGAELDVAGDNPRALRLYESVGLHPVQTTDAYERPA